VESEHAETRQVGGGGEEVEIGVDFGSPSDAGSSAAVSSAHQVTEFPFDFGSGRPIIRDPVGVVLLTPSIDETVFVTPDTDTPTSLGIGAFRTQHTPGAGIGERGEPVAVAAPSDGDGHIVGAGHGVGVEIDDETVFR
jgi:hypothetical protein